MSKQDRQGVRRASDLEQKYKLGLLSDGHKDNLRGQVGRINQVLSDFMTTINNRIKEVEKKADFPIGSVFMTVGTANPSVQFGGKWELIAEGYLVVSQDKEPPELFQANDKCYVWKRTS